MIRRKVKIINKLGLHARASSKLTQLACTFSSEIFLIKDNDKVISLEATGVDEKEAITSIESLFTNYFGEGD